MRNRPADTRQLRAVRGGSAAVVAVLLAATSHTVSGGTAPPLWLLAAVTLLAWPLAVALIGRRPSAARTAAAVSAAQALLHTAFATVGSARPRGLGAHVHGPLTLASPGEGMSIDVAMVAGHVLAAVVTTILLCTGEHLLRGIADGLRALLPAVPMTLPFPAPAPRAATGVLRAAGPRVTLSGLSRRGPPR
ncbi:hypothetical protein AB3M83_11800 [Microbacterium sp. 179-B 1A2 NHS]|uniref:hypothetical protein n=1 Tax=Microbacterium sp. 179-B 1A2 NHS TaxID=3142383 RepID=UPI0039A1B946